MIATGLSASDREDPLHRTAFNPYVILSVAVAKSKDLGVAAYIIFLRFAGFPGLRSE